MKQTSGCPGGSSSSVSLAAASPSCGASATASSSLPSAAAASPLDAAAAGSGVASAAAASCAASAAPAFSALSALLAVVLSSDVVGVGATTPAAASATGLSCLVNASCRLLFIIRSRHRSPHSTTPSGREFALGSGTRLFSGSSSPKNPIIATSSVSKFGKRDRSTDGCSQRSSHVDDTPRNQAVAWVAVSKTGSPSTASCSMDHKTVRLRARPQSLPSQAGTSPRSNAAVSKSPSGNHFTPLFCLA
mmetsp:Transcript_154058/g.287141  ORF Transcript_154058/g.287141 Transcript_154058/m.287141 type:complete len:247 (-) Transcript_154058:321-1061(-)